MTHTLLQSGVIGTLFDVRWSLVAQANPENDEIFLFVLFHFHQSPNGYHM